MTTSWYGVGYVRVCVCVCVCVCVRVCVCVEHLNRCKTSNNVFQFAGACSTFGILHATKLLPLVGRGGWSPPCTCRVSVRTVEQAVQYGGWFWLLHSFRNLTTTLFLVIWIAIWAFQSISEITAGLWMDNLWSGLFSTFRIFLHWISDEYFVEDSPLSLFCWVLHSWDSIPTWSDEGSIFV